MKKYTQCRLRRNRTEQIAWIPSRFAKVGSVIKIETDGEWVDGWKVIDAFSEADDVPHFALVKRVHRKRTGDSEPKVKNDRS